MTIVKRALYRMMEIEIRADLLNSLKFRLSQSFEESVNVATCANAKMAP